MDRLWSPWRSEYVTGNAEDEGCFLCSFAESDDDEKNHVLWRGDRAFVVLNAYPYNSGHAMVAPRRHVGDAWDLEGDERTELFDAAFMTIDAIRDVMGPHGFNVGMNLGTVAGAGVPGHLHVHVVPRWGGDTNFMPAVSETKVLPELLSQTYAKLRPAFPR